MVAALLRRKLIMLANIVRLPSLRSRLMILVALAITPTVAMTVYNGWQEQAQAIRSAEENLQRLTNLAAANEAQSLEGARQILRDLSSVPTLLADQKDCSTLLADILKKNAAYANFGVIQLNGDVSCSAVPSTVPVNLADRAHFQKAVKERRFVAGNYVFGRVIQKYTINLTYPVTNTNNEVTAVVFAALDLTELDKYVSNIRLPSGSVLLTADAEGTVIARRPNPEQWFGKKIPDDMRSIMASDPGRPVVMAGMDGVERLHTFARVGARDVDYTVTIGIPSDAILASARRDQIMALSGLAATSVLALLAAWFFGDYLIVRRIRILRDTANRIASGSLSTRTGIHYGREEFGQLARAVDEMASALQHKEAEHNDVEEKLRTANKRKDEFLAMLAHELRNPLAPISAGAELLKLGQMNSASVAQTADIIHRQVEHMTRLVDDLLDMSRVTRGLVTLTKQPLDMQNIVMDAVEQVRPLIDSKGHRLTLNLPAAPAGVAGDGKRLVQVVTNLLNNAAKYTPDGGGITLDLGVYSDEVLS